MGMNGLSIRLEMSFTAQDLVGLPTRVVQSLSELATAAVQLHAGMERIEKLKIREELTGQITLLQEASGCLRWLVENGYEWDEEGSVQKAAPTAAIQTDADGTTTGEKP